MAKNRDISDDTSPLIIHAVQLGGAELTNKSVDIDFPIYLDIEKRYIDFKSLLFLIVADTRGLRAPQQVEQLQDQAQSMLGEYDRQTFPSQQVRFGRLLLMLPSLRALSTKCIEQMFFRGTLDNIPMERLLSDMFKSA